MTLKKFILSASELCALRSVRARSMKVKYFRIYYVVTVLVVMTGRVLKKA